MIMWHGRHSSNEWQSVQQHGTKKIVKLFSPISEAAAHKLPYVLAFCKASFQSDYSTLKVWKRCSTNRIHWFFLKASAAKDSQVNRQKWPALSCKCAVCAQTKTADVQQQTNLVKKTAVAFTCQQLGMCSTTLTAWCQVLKTQPVSTLLCLLVQVWLAEDWAAVSLCVYIGVFSLDPFISLWQRWLKINVTKGKTKAVINLPLSRRKKSCFVKQYT